MERISKEWLLAYISAAEWTASAALLHQLTSAEGNAHNHAEITVDMDPQLLAKLTAKLATDLAHLEKLRTEEGKITRRDLMSSIKGTVFALAGGIISSDTPNTEKDEDVTARTGLLLLIGATAGFSASSAKSSNRMDGHRATYRQLEILQRQAHKLDYAARNGNAKSAPGNF